MATRNKTYISFVFVNISLLLLAGLIHTKTNFPTIKVSKQNSALNFNNDLIRIFSAGQKRLITDLLWITTLLESDHEHYKQRDLNSWMFLRFKSITLLDPLFLSAYRYGGKYLSIIKDDLLGAKEIFDDGLSVFPEDYNLIYDAAFLYSFELNDFKTGASLYRKLALNPQAPEFIVSLVSKLELEVHNDLELAFKVVNEMREATEKETSLYRKLTKDLYAIKAEIDLKCLNEEKSNCSRKDFLGYPYLFKDKKYYSKFPFKKYRFKTPKR